MRTATTTTATKIQKIIITTKSRKNEITKNLLVLLLVR